MKLAKNITKMEKNTYLRFQKFLTFPFKFAKTYNICQNFHTNTNTWYNNGYTKKHSIAII